MTREEDNEKLITKVVRREKRDVITTSLVGIILGAIMVVATVWFFLDERFARASDMKAMKDRVDKIDETVNEKLDKIVHSIHSIDITIAEFHGKKEQ